MVTVVAIFVVLVLAQWLCAALAIAVLLVNWGAPAGAAFITLVYADRLGADPTAALLAALLAFAAVRVVIVRVVRSIAAAWPTATEPRPQPSPNFALLR